MDIDWSKEYLSFSDIYCFFSNVVLKTYIQLSVRRLVPSPMLCRCAIYLVRIVAKTKSGARFEIAAAAILIVPFLFFKPIFRHIFLQFF